MLRRRTWIILVVVDVVIWVIAEVQNSGGTLSKVFDGIWVASLIVFVLLIVLGFVAVIRSRRTRPAN